LVVVAVAAEMEIGNRLAMVVVLVSLGVVGGMSRSYAAIVMKCEISRGIAVYPLDLAALGAIVGDIGQLQAVKACVAACGVSFSLHDPVGGQTFDGLKSSLASSR
jgi:hypothetical protein